MKLTRRVLALLLGSVLLFCAFPAGAAPEAEDPELAILFTHDMHDHFYPMPADGGGEYGGFTRLSTLLREQRAAFQAQGVPAVTLDAGDFSMGSLFQTIYASDAPELRAMGAMGFDATTLGNHEFDYRSQGLAAMLNAARASGDPLPALVQANYTTPKDRDSGSAVVEALQNYPVTDYAVLERGGLRVAVFGVLGEGADASAPMSGMELEPIVQAARRVVADIRARESPDWIVCLSHSGTDRGGGEDYELAKAVDGIDVIISGHTHATLEKPIRVNDTLIVSCGEYTQNLGVLRVSKPRGGGPIKLEDYRLVPVDETVEQDDSMAALAYQFRKRVEEEYLSVYGLDFWQVLARAPFGFTPIQQFGQGQEDDALGNLIVDSYVHAVRRVEGEDYVPIDFAMTAAGVIRASFAAGEITVSDVFNVSSLGSGADGTPGYPLVSAWLTGRELKDLFELDASVSPLMPAARLYGAGMTWTYNPHRLIFNRVTSCGRLEADGTVIPLENDRLYRVVTGLYCAQMLEAAKGKSLGLLSITPRDESGAPVTDFESRIIHTPGGSELKEWYALASYLASFPPVDGVPQVPGSYARPAGHKRVLPSWNPVELLKNPNWMTLLAVFLTLLVLSLAGFAVHRAVSRTRRGRKGR